MPALALAQAVQALDANIEPVLIGSARGVERDILPSRDYRYHLLPSEPIYRRQWWRNARWPVLLLKLRRQLEALFDQEQPAVVVGTGGYASAPVIWFGQHRRIPTALQEQNAFPGLATRWFSRDASHVYLGIPEGRNHLRPGPNTLIHDTGNPVVPPDFSIRESARARFGLESDRATVLVTGGSQGAMAVNRTVAEWLEGGGGVDMNLLWVTGKLGFPELARFHNPPAVQVFDFLDPMAEAYAVANVVVGRAGALTLAELCAWGLPSILIPLPTAAADHQTRNAEAMARAGAAWFLPQSELTAAHLGARLESLVQDHEVRIEMSMAANERGRPAAASDIASHIVSLFP